MTLAFVRKYCAAHFTVRELIITIQMKLSYWTNVVLENLNLIKLMCLILLSTMQ